LTGLGDCNEPRLDGRIAAARYDDDYYYDMMML
jgi:hypothetical protein